MNEFESDWISLSQSFVQNNKGLNSKMAEFKMAELKMAAIIKLSQNEWVKFILCKMAQSNMAEFKMAVIIKLIDNVGVWVRLN